MFRNIITRRKRILAAAALGAYVLAVSHRDPLADFEKGGGHLNAL